ncbi:MAG: Crp/Fnr family transcriptional regulator [Gemmatimonadales bacterium]
MIEQSLLQSHPLFRSAVPEALAVLGPAGQHREWQSRQLLFRRGDRGVGLILILQGRVRVVREQGNRRQLLHSEGAGGALGEIPMLDDGPMVATGIASEPTIGLVIPRVAVRQALALDAALAWGILERVATRVRHLADRLEDATFRGVGIRLAAVLLERHRIAAGAPMTFGMSQQHLADDLGTVREVIVRELRSLVRGGVLTAAGQGRYTVADLELLRAIAAGR